MYKKKILVHNHLKGVVKMKYKKTILVLSIFIISFIYIGHPLAEKNLMKNYDDRLIRFHIKANSDREEDQELKLKIRDKILDEMGYRFGDTKSLDESRSIIMENMDEMKALTEEVIREEGENYEVEISLGQDTFPTRKYGDLVLPGGEYETLLISLGEAKGQNWWCVMFPPLCFVDITHWVAYGVEEDVNDIEVSSKQSDSIKKIEQLNNRESIKISDKQIKQELEEDIEKEPELKLKWKIVELFEKFKKD